MGSGTGSITIADWVQIGRFAAGLDTPSSSSEFQRADCAPRLNNGVLVLGNGAITITDWVQAGRYAAGLDPVTPAGGPTEVHAPGQSITSQGPGSDSPAQTVIRLGSCTLVCGETNFLVVSLDSAGDVNALGFSISFNAALARFVEATVSGSAQGALLNLNASQANNGSLGIALAMPAAQTLPAGSTPLLEIKFAGLIPSQGAVPIQLVDQPLAREVVSAGAHVLSATYANGTLTVLDAFAVDSDQDGIPDGWELAYGLDPFSAFDADADDDGDGQTNIQEYIAGTDPRDPSSVLGVASMETIGSDLQVSFNTVADKVYRLEISDVSPAGPWTGIGSPIVGDGKIKQVADTGIGDQSIRFYRVVVQSP